MSGVAAMMLGCYGWQICCYVVAKVFFNYFAVCLLGCSSEWVLMCYAAARVFKVI